LLGAGLLAISGASPALVVGVFLVGYNAGHLALRARGLRVGVEHGLQVAAGIRAMGLSSWTERIRSLGVLLVGLALGFLLSRGAGGLPWGPAWIAGALALLSAGLSGGELARRWGPELLILLLLVGSWFEPS
jgi:hypothetical protein